MLKVEAGGEVGPGSEPFPEIRACRTPDAGLDAALHWVGAHTGELEDALRRHGAIVFRGFPLVSDLDFDAFVRAFDLPNFRYEESLSNAVRVVRTDRVFTANEAPSEATIRLHHEMAQTPIHPSRLFFFCEEPADEGGATSLCRSDRLFEALAELRPDFAADCEEHGLIYHLVMPREDDPASAVGRGWLSTFDVADRDGAEARMRRLGYSWTWLPGDCLRTSTPVLPAVRPLEPDPATGARRRSFFNQLIAARSWKDSRNDPAQAVTLGDGRSLDPDAWALVVELAEQLAVDWSWQRGDVALVDNHRVMHGRRSFRGTRRLLASLVAEDA